MEDLRDRWYGAFRGNLVSGEVVLSGRRVILFLPALRAERKGIFPGERYPTLVTARLRSLVVLGHTITVCPSSACRASPVPAASTIRAHFGPYLSPSCFGVNGRLHRAQRGFPATAMDANIPGMVHHP